MIHRASKLHLPTLRDAPSDAEALSHKLLVRGGFIRQVSAGLWTFLPLGWRVHRKVEQVIREELDAIGAQEMFAPVLTPAELWIKSGRYGIPELFKLQDRNGRDYVLPLTHEETFAFHAVELQSYRQLPQSWYHFQTKDRDEPRPRGGLLRVREFVMKDSYSFDRDEAGLDVSFQAHKGAYERIFERCGLETRRRPGGERDDGRQGVDGLPRALGIGREHARDVRERRLCGRPRDRVRRSARARVPGAARRARRDRDAGHPYVRGARRAALDRPRGDDEGDAGRQGRRHARARAPARRRPPRGGEAAIGARLRLSTGDRRGDRGGLRRRGRLARPGRIHRPDRRRRDAARGAVRLRREPHRLAPARRGGGPRLLSPSSRTSASRRRATRARTAAAGSASRSRSRSATSSSSAPATRRRSAPSTWTRTAPRSRS